MKTLLFLTGIVAFAYACNDQKTETSTIQSDTTNHTATAPQAYTPSEGDVTFRNGKVLVWKNNEWVVTDREVTLENGTVVHPNGHVEKDRDTIVLDDGQVVNKSGRFFDKAGNAMDDAWDATKKGAKEAGEAVKKGANKVGEEVKEVFDDDKKKDSSH